MRWRFAYGNAYLFYNKFPGISLGDPRDLIEGHFIVAAFDLDLGIAYYYLCVLDNSISMTANNHRMEWIIHGTVTITEVIIR